MRESVLVEGKSLPLLIAPESETERSAESLLGWIEQERDGIAERLKKSGAVLFRGFDLAGADTFKKAVMKFQHELQNYIEGQSQRDKISDKIYNSTYYPPEERITLHNELSYTENPPRYLFFFCERPATEGGETPIVDCRKLLEKIAPETLAPFREKGVRYVKNMHGGKGFGKSWQEHFESEDRTNVEAYLGSHDVDFEWLDDSTLRTRQERPSVTRHPETGEEIWFNQASLWHVSDQGKRGKTLLRMLGEDHLATHAYFGGGDRIEEPLLEEIRRATWDEATIFPWRKGDLLFVDNYLVAHGRNAYSGDRLLLVAMG